MFLSKDKLSSKLNYDSHTHFFGVGLPAVDFIISKDDTSLNLPDHLLPQKLIRGFGWSSKLSTDELDALCKVHPHKKFCLSYYDGHSSFVSTNLTDELGFTPQKGQKTSCGWVLSEVERDEFLKLIPQRPLAELEKMALHAQKIFKENDITKVRHLTGSYDHWSCLQKLRNEKKLDLKIEVFFSEFMGQSLKAALSSFHKARVENTNSLKAVGIKVFYDGSFGSNTAYVSSKTGKPPRISKNELSKKMELVLIKNKVPLAVHTIGDLALDDVISVYSALSDEHKNLPALHLEHAPIFSKDTLDILKSNKLNCIFHFQPSHWTSDQLWYAENKNLLSPHQIYPFMFLDKLEYEYHFGSDAPVVAPTKENTLLGLKAIEQTISQI